MPTVVTAGELLVEIMRPEPGIPLDTTGPFRGPFPSGAPGIFVDAVQRLGVDAGIVGAVGDDAFGRVVLDRLSADGVDTSQVQVLDDRTTGVAFVSYDGAGNREFLFHLAHAAAGKIDAAALDTAWLADARAVHVSGSAVAMNEAMAGLCRRLVALARERDLLVSVDPNVRPALLRSTGTMGDLDEITRQADLVTPTAAELRAMAAAGATEAERARALLDDGAELVAVTKGADGCTVYTRDDPCDHPGFPTDAVDPTGAGDAFAAGLVVSTLEGMGIAERAAFANAVASRAVRAFGPMEGLPERAAVDETLATG